MFEQVDVSGGALDAIEQSFIPYILTHFWVVRGLLQNTNKIYSVMISSRWNLLIFVILREKSLAFMNLWNEGTALHHDDTRGHNLGVKSRLEPNDIEK